MPYKIGDKIWIEVFVTDIIETKSMGTCVGVYTGSDNFYVTKNQIMKHIPVKDFNVDDLVKLPSGDIYRILATHKNECWVVNLKGGKTLAVPKSLLASFQSSDQAHAESSI